MEAIWDELKLMQGLLVAFVLSGAIGWEREQLHRSAGLRTHMLIGMSSALFVVLAETLITSFGDWDNGVRFDMIGLLGAVVSGISGRDFLGPGAQGQGPDHGGGHAGDGGGGCGLRAAPVCAGDWSHASVPVHAVRDQPADQGGGESLC